MKSFFTKLGKLLLCGVAVAVVGCTDFSEDIKAVGDKVDALEQQTAADIQKAIADLQASIDTKFATKEALAALESDLEGEISSQIASLKSTLETAINQKADKATVEAEFLIVKEDLADLETALATAKAALQAEIAKKADQTALDAALVRVSALETTVAGLSGDVASLIAMIQQHDFAITNLTGFQQTATEKLADLEAQDKALKALIEAEVEDLYDEIETVEEFASAIDRLYKEADEELWAKLNELDTDVWTKIEVLDGAITALNNLLNDEADKRANEDEQLQLQINKALEAISAVNTLLEDNRAELDAKDAELENEITLLITTTNTLTETISAVNNRVDDVESALNAHIAAAAAYKKSLEETLEALKTAAGNHDFAITNINTLLDEAVKDIAVLVSEDAKIKAEIAQIYAIVTNYATRFETNEGAIEDLQKENKEIKEQIAQHLTAITNHEKSIETLTDNVDDLLAADNEIRTIISQLESAVLNLTYGSATKEELNELRGDLNKQVETINAAIKAANDRVDELFNLIVSDLNGRIQSVVFVPGHSDLCATADIYLYGYEDVQVVVKATYQVTPAAHVVKVGKELDVQGVLQLTEYRYGYTRAAADEYAWAEAAYVTDINESTGKFDVEYVFDIEDIRALVDEEDIKVQRLGGLVLGTFVQHPDNVMPVDEVDDEMGVTVDTYFKNYKVSDFAAVAEHVVEYSYVLVDENDEEYEVKTDIVPWSANDDVRIKTPYAGYTLKIETEEGDIVTLDEFAQTMHLADAAPITPVFRHEQAYSVADAKTAEFKKDPETAVYKDENATCKNVHAFADPEDKGINREFTIAVENPTNEDAPKLIGHKLHNDLIFFFWNASKTNKRNVEGACYNYIIDYRTFEFTLTGNEKLTGTIADQHVLDWTYPVAVDLAEEGENGLVANQKNINEEFNIKFSEYDLIPGEENVGLSDRYVDYKDIIEKYAASEVRNVEYTVDAKRSATLPQGAKKPDLTVLPKTGIIHDIAAIDIEGGTYEFIGKDVTYHFTNIFTDDVETYTKVKYNYDLTLGDKPMHVDVVADEEVIKYKATPWTDVIDFAALTRAELAPAYKFPATYNSADDATNTGVAELYARTSPVTNLGEAKEPTRLLPGSGQVGLSAKDQQTIFNYNGANQKGYLTRTFKTWYGTEFHFELPFKIEAPAYKLDINPLHVAVVGEENIATANYLYVPEQGDDRTFTVVNSFMQDYFRVLNPDQENELKVTFTILSADVDKAGLVHSTPRFTNGAVEITRGVNDEGSFLRTSSELEWGDYHYTYVHVKAQLLVNGVAFGEPVIVRINTEDPLNLSGNDNLEVKWVDNKDIVVEDILNGATVHVIDQETVLEAGKFMAGSYKKYYNKATAYGAELTAELEKVYFNDPAKGGDPTDVPSGYYTLEGNKLTIKKETANLETAVYAKVKVTMDYILDCDKPEVVYVTYVFNR